MDKEKEICNCGDCSACKERDFWKRHTIVTVNGVDMIATRATEDSPSELL